MIVDFGSFVINESSLRKLKRDIHGALGMSDRKRMRHELKHNIITFKFRKRNGDLRTAHGTLHPDYLPALKGGSPRPERQMVYFDLDKDGWRSFRSYSFIKITDIKPVGEPKKHSKPVETEEEDDVKKIKPSEKEEKIEMEEKKVHKEKVENEEPEEHKKVHKEEPEDVDSKEDDSEKDEEAFTKKKPFNNNEHKEKGEHKDEHDDEDKKDDHKEKDEDE